MNILLIRENISRWIVAIYSSHCFPRYTCWRQQRKLGSLQTSPLPFRVGQFEARCSHFYDTWSDPKIMAACFQMEFAWQSRVPFPVRGPTQFFAQKSSYKVQASRKAGLVPARGLWDVTPATAVNICWEPKIWVNNFRVEPVTHTLRQQGDSG